MADPRFVGTEIRRRMGAESSHLAMAEHPSQPDPIGQAHMQKAAAKAEGHVAPCPSCAKALQGTSSKKVGEYVPKAGASTRNEILKSFGD